MKIVKPKDYPTQSQHRQAMVLRKKLQHTLQYTYKLVDHQIPSDIDQTQSESGYFSILHNGEVTQLPIDMLAFNQLTQIFKANQVISYLSPQDQQHLKGFLPEGLTVKEGLQTVLQKQVFFGKPIDRFWKAVKNKQFTKNHLLWLDTIDKLGKIYMMDYLAQIYDKLNRPSKTKTRMPRPIEPDSDLSELNDVPPMHQGPPDDQSFLTCSESQFQQLQNNPEQQKQQQMMQVFFKYQDRRKTQQQLLAISDEKFIVNKIKAKPTHFIKHNRSQKWIQNYRHQEKLRYDSPHIPWPYFCQDGRKVVVPPVAKKASSVGSKPREHPLLRLVRPSCVNILTLVRDAAARLPSGVGTRADICQLLKQSQYINDNLSEQKLSTIVSGALDRLHYMQDACVRYDCQKKLWIYLHGDRDEQSFLNGDGQQWSKSRY